MKRHILIGCIVTVACYSCIMEEQAEVIGGHENIRVLMPSDKDTKVTLGDESAGRISQLWSPGDRIALIQDKGTEAQKISVYELVGDGGSVEGEFKHISGDADERGSVDIIYPVSSVNMNKVPSLQAYVSGSYDPSSVLLSWHSDDGIPENGVLLSNRTAILCLQYTGTSQQKVTSVRVKIYSSETMFEEYRVSDSEGVALSSEPKQFYLSVPEVTNGSKVVFEVILDDHSVMSVVSEGRVFLPGRMYRFQPLQYTADVQDRERLSAQIYTPSNNANLYYPIYVNRSSVVPVKTWVQEKTRIIDNMIGYVPENALEQYESKVNRYGSRTDKGCQAATGRFYVKKVDGRFFFVDPEGYLHHHRGVASLRQGPSTRNVEAFHRKYENVDSWLERTAEEFAELGFHGSGAFCTDTYDDIQVHNRQHPERPITLAPSFSFLSSFRKKYSLSYLNDKSNTAICLVLDQRWPTFCKDYISTNLAPYIDDPNTIGFFSDNEIDFTSNSVKLLDRVLESGNTTHPAYLLAKDVMGTETSVTDALNDTFVGKLAELYYKGIKEALLEVTGEGPRILYLGSRLHGKPKNMQGVVTAAGRWCDVISINYYSSWNADLTTKIADWESWAPETPFLITEFYTKALDNDLDNVSGAGYVVPTQIDRAYAYQHFTLGLLESRNCVGWHWFRYQDDDSDDLSDNCSNKGIFDNYYEPYPWLAQYMRQLNTNVYNLIDYFDK